MIPLDRTKPVGTCLLDCGESGSTLRFPAGGRGPGGRGHGANGGPLGPAPPGAPGEQLRKGGCAVTLWEEEKRLTISGQLRPGEYHLPGDVSSQFISGMLFAPAPAAGWQPVGGGGRAGVGQLSPADSPGPGDLWPDAQRAGGGLDDCFPGVRQPRRGTGGGGLVQRGPLALPGHAGGERASPSPEWTWIPSRGDRAVCRVLAAMGGQVRTAADRVTVLPGPRVPTRMDARDIPDLVPVLAAVAAATPRRHGDHRGRPAAAEGVGPAGDHSADAERLGRAGGGDGGWTSHSGKVPPVRGDRWTPQATTASPWRRRWRQGACTGPVTITGAQAVEKSYPTFWAELRSLGKQVEETPVGP